MAERFIRFLPSRGDNVELGDSVTLIEQLSARKSKDGAAFTRFTGRVVEIVDDQLTVFLMEAQSLDEDLRVRPPGHIDDEQLFNRVTINRMHVEAFETRSTP
jgi:hypothetical protein